MSIAQKLNDVQSFFVQECPLCSRPNRIVARGVYRDETEMRLYPDIGYSFCNCKNIFYTRFENLNTGVGQEDANPVDKMKKAFDFLAPGRQCSIVLPDPFFCEWGNDPYKTFLHWNPRVHWILWDKDQFEDELKAIGFEIISSKRQFDVRSDSPQTFEFIVKKPEEGK